MAATGLLTRRAMMLLAVGGATDTVVVCAQGAYVVMFKSDVSTTRMDEIIAGLEGVKIKNRYALGNFKGFAASLTDEQLENVLKLDEVELFEPDGEITAFASKSTKLGKK